MFRQTAHNTFFLVPAGHFMNSELATFRRKIDVFGGTVKGFGRAKTAGLPAVFFEGLW